MAEKSYDQMRACKWADFGSWLVADYQLSDFFISVDDLVDVHSFHF